MRDRLLGGPRPIRYAVASVMVACGGVALVAFAYTVLGWSSAASVALSATLLTWPSFHINRRFVWQHEHDPARATQQLALFWATSVGGGILGVGIAALAEHLAQSLERSVRLSVTLAAPLAGQAIIWVAKYFFLDRAVFTHAETTEAS